MIFIKLIIINYFFQKEFYIKGAHEEVVSNVEEILSKLRKGEGDLFSL